MFPSPIKRVKWMQAKSGPADSNQELQRGKVSFLFSFLVVLIAFDDKVKTSAGACQKRSQSIKKGLPIEQSPARAIDHYKEPRGLFKRPLKWREKTGFAHPTPANMPLQFPSHYPMDSDGSIGFVPHPPPPLLVRPAGRLDLAPARFHWRSN